MHTGSKDCDASSRITKSNIFGMWWMLIEANVTNHNFLAWKYCWYSSIEVNFWLLEFSFSNFSSMLYLLPSLIILSMGIFPELKVRSRMLSSDRLVKVVISTDLLSEWHFSMSFTISSVLPVPGIPSISVQYSEVNTFSKAFFWFGFKVYMSYGLVVIGYYFSEICSPFCYFWS